MARPQPLIGSKWTQVLEDDQTEGEPFRVERSGRYTLFVEDLTSSTELHIQHKIDYKWGYTGDVITAATSGLVTVSDVTSGILEILLRRDDDYRILCNEVGASVKLAFLGNGF